MLKEKKKFKIIMVTPSGRKNYMEYLLKSLIIQKDDFLEWHLWNNTRNKEDEEYIYLLQSQYDWIKVINIDNLEQKGSNFAINSFWKLNIYHDDSTIYIRLDDDIVWLSPNFIKRMIEIRIKYTQAPFVYANIVNNNYIAYYQQSNKKVLQDLPKITKDCMGNLWNSPDLTLKLHEEFAIHRRNNEYDKWFINNLLLSDYKRVSINCISWFGSLFQKQIVKNTEYVDDEQYYSVEVPKMLKKPNIICGNALCLHFAFFTQRIPNSKNEILDDKLHVLLE